MRKDIPIVILSLFLLLFSSQAAFGSQADWQINWQEDGTLQETVSIKDLSIQFSDPGWQKESSGNQLRFSRTVKSWEEYNGLQDKLPLRAEVRNYVFFNFNTISAANQAASGTLYQALQGVDRLNVKMIVPGKITSSSIKPSDEQTVIMVIDKPNQGLLKDFTLKTINLDGFMLGITILSLGVIGLFFFFIGRMRKVDRLIEETYSLDNVVIEDDEDEASSEEEKKEKV